MVPDAKGKSMDTCHTFLPKGIYTPPFPSPTTYVHKVGGDVIQALLLRSLPVSWIRSWWLQGRHFSPLSRTHCICWQNSQKLLPLIKSGSTWFTLCEKRTLNCSPLGFNHISILHQYLKALSIHGFIKPEISMGPQHTDLPTMLTSHMDPGLCPDCSTSDPALCLRPGKTVALGERPRKGSRLSTSD